MFVQLVLQTQAIGANDGTGWHDIAGALTYKGTHHVFQVRNPPSWKSPAELLLRLRMLLCTT
jgi:hypothetical protein